MGRVVVVNPAAGGAPPRSFSAFWTLTGEIEAASASSETIRARTGDLPIHVKRHRYSPAAAVRGALRNTFVGPSRAAREYRMLLRFAELGAAPRPVAYGEHRVLGFLRGAFVATQTEEGAGPLDRLANQVDPAFAARLGAFLGRLHGSGLVHGRLFARNLLVRPDGTFRVVDLDRARAGSGRRASRRERAKDLAFLHASLPDIGSRLVARALAAYRRAAAESREGLRALLAAGVPARAEAVRRLARRHRRRDDPVSSEDRTSPSSSGATPG